MKKIVLLLALSAGLGLTAKAQDKPVSFGVKAGLALPNQTASAMGLSVSTSSKTSFYVGAVANINLSPMFTFQPGLTFIGKGGKVDFSDIAEEFGFDEDDVADMKATTNMSYLELPLNLLANFAAGNGKVFIGAGPFAAYALSGNDKVGGEKVDYEFGSGDDQVKRMEFGLNFLGGYQLKSGLNIHAGYGLGLSNLQNSSNEKVKNKVFTVGLGFNF